MLENRRALPSVIGLAGIIVLGLSAQGCALALRYQDTYLVRGSIPQGDGLTLAIQNEPVGGWIFSPIPGLFGVRVERAPYETWLTFRDYSGTIEALSVNRMFVKDPDSGLKDEITASVLEDFGRWVPLVAGRSGCSWLTRKSPATLGVRLRSDRWSPPGKPSSRLRLTVEFQARSHGQVHGYTTEFDLAHTRRLIPRVAPLMH